MSVRVFTLLLGCILFILVHPGMVICASLACCATFIAPLFISIMNLRTMHLAECTYHLHVGWMS